MSTVRVSIKKIKDRVKEYQQSHASTSAAPPQPAPVAAVVGPQYCCPHPMDLAIFRKVMSVEDKFTVTDINGKVVFKLRGFPMPLHDHRVLLDADQKPVVTLRSKVRSMHGRWQAFRGDSYDPKDLIFSLKRSAMIQIKTKLLDVFLASNTSKQVCDFKIKGSWSERSCVVYDGKSGTTNLAQMHEKHTVKSVMLGETNFMVTVYPNVDYAFIVALVVILDEINKDSSGE